MSVLRDIYTISSNGVPKQFTNMMKVGKRYEAVKGQLNKLRVRPSILNEHVESSRESMGVVTSSNIIGQMFKASKSDINGILLTLSSAAGVDIDGFESYATDGDLRVVWVHSGSGSYPASLDQTIVYEGVQSMRMRGEILNDKWVKTLSSSDFRGYTFSFPWYQDKEYNKLKFEFILSDGVDTLSFPLVVTQHNKWVIFEVNIDAMSDSGSTDKSAITSIGFRVSDKESGFFGYVDDIVATPQPGSVKIKLWDCGVSLPVADGSSFDLTNDATQYTELGDWGISGSVVSEVDVPLIGGKRLYSINTFIAGVAMEHPSNTILNEGNYYAITIHYVDTDVSVWGPDTTFETKYYQNGYAFYTSSEGTDITKISGALGGGAYSDLMFGVLSTQEVYLISYGLYFNAGSGGPATTGPDANWVSIVEDSNMIVEAVATTHGGHAIVDGAYKEEFSWRPHYMENGGKFEVYYNDDYTDSVSGIELEFTYLYEPPTING